jgi:hypothetical protein
MDYSLITQWAVFRRFQIPLGHNYLFYLFSFLNRELINQEGRRRMKKKLKRNVNKGKKPIRYTFSETVHTSNMVFNIASASVRVKSIPI